MMKRMIYRTFDPIRCLTCDSLQPFEAMGQSLKFRCRTCGHIYTKADLIAIGATENDFIEERPSDATNATE